MKNSQAIKKQLSMKKPVLITPFSGEQKENARKRTREMCQVAGRFAMKVRDRHEGQRAKCSSLTIARYAKHGIWPRWTRKCIRVSRNTPAVGAVPVSKSLGKGDL